MCPADHVVTNTIRTEISVINGAIIILFVSITALFYSYVVTYRVLTAHRCGTIKASLRSDTYHIIIQNMSLEQLFV